MKAFKTPIEGLIEFQLNTYFDERGSFFESFRHSNYFQHIENSTFLQDNCSRSKVNVLRGLHFQIPPFAQAKLVHVVQGSAIDVAVDLRKKSPTYGEHYTIELSAENGKQLYIPRGFAHGFCALEENTIFSYKCDNLYDAASERTLLYNDKSLDIKWPDKEWIISPKDLNGISFADFDSPF